MRSDSFKTRIRITSIVIVMLGAAIITRLFFLQVVHGASFRDEADNRYQSKTGDLLTRGTIYFSKKGGELVTAATIAEGSQLEIQSKLVTDASVLYDALTPYIETQITKEEFVKKITPGANQYKVIARELSKDTADKIQALGLAGVTVKKDTWRLYPGNTLAAQVMGFVGYDETTRGQDGRYGLERAYESVLGQAAQNLYINFFAEVFANIKNTVFESDARDGDLITTIEPVVQNTLEEALIKIDKTWATDGTGGIIMDPVTGEILAMAATPAFDPNNYGKALSASVFTNPNVESVFEFGSVIKPLVMAGALDAGVVTKDTIYTDHGFVKVGDRTIYNFDKVGRGPGTTMQDVLNQSLNTGMVFVEQKLGKEKFKNYLFSYEIDKKTGIDLPGEVQGLVSNLKTNRDVELANASFGQGIALTPIEAVRAFSALGTGGLLPTPHVVKEIKYQFGSKEIPHLQTTTPVWNPDISQKITDMLVTVGDGIMKTYKVSLPHNDIAMKTGTAQMANLVTGGYYAQKYMHSMFAYFPAYDPKFIIFIYAKDPKGAKFAAQTLATPMLGLSNFLVDYYNVAPDK